MTQQEFLSRRRALLAQMQPQRRADFRRTGSGPRADSEYPTGRTAILVLHGI